MTTTVTAHEQLAALQAAYADAVSDWERVKANELTALEAAGDDRAARRHARATFGADLLALGDRRDNAADALLRYVRNYLLAHHPEHAELVASGSGAALNPIDAPSRNLRASLLKAAVALRLD